MNPNPKSFLNPKQEQSSFYFSSPSENIYIFTRSLFWTDACASILLGTCSTTAAHSPGECFPSLTQSVVGGVKGGVSEGRGQKVTWVAPNAVHINYSGGWTRPAGRLSWGDRWRQNSNLWGCGPKVPVGRCQPKL